MNWFEFSFSTFFNRCNYNILNIIWILIPSWIRMKIWPLISVFFIATLVCAPVFAISASELISSHRTGSPYSINIPTRLPSVTPTATPAPQATITPLPTRNMSSVFDSFSNIGIFSTPTIQPRRTLSPINTQIKLLSCPPSCPVGELHHVMCSCEAPECIDPKTGWPYPIGGDMVGRLFIVKEGCPAKWADR